MALHTVTVAYAHHPVTSDSSKVVEVDVAVLVGLLLSWNESLSGLDRICLYWPSALSGRQVLLLGQLGWTQALCLRSMLLLGINYLFVIGLKTGSIDASDIFFLFVAHIISQIL